MAEEKYDTKITGNTCMSLCEFVYLHDSEDIRFDEISERSPKTSPFDRQEGTRITGNPCLTTITIILYNSMYIIIYIDTKINGIPVYRVTLCTRSGGRPFA